MSTAPRTMRRKNGGFTLVELLVVLAVIALLAGAVLPSMAGLFTAGADSQAYNLIAAQLAAARALAIQEGRLAGVHVQPAAADVKASLAGGIFAAVVWDPNSTGTFTLADGFIPQRIPGAMAFLQLSPPTGEYAPTGNLLDPNLSFTVVFTPSGGLYTGNVKYDPAGLFDPGPKGLWTHTQGGGLSGELAVKAMWMFDFDGLRNLTAPADRQTYVRNYGQVLPINHYTGALMGRERQ